MPRTQRQEIGDERKRGGVGWVGFSFFYVYIYSDPLRLRNEEINKHNNNSSSRNSSNSSSKKIGNMCRATRSRYHSLKWKRQQQQLFNQFFVLVRCATFRIVPNHQRWPAKWKHARFGTLQICMLSRCLATKFLRQSSVGSLLRVSCWLGSRFSFPN